MFPLFSFGSFARQQNQPIDFGAVRFFDDETALHLLNTSVGVMAGLEVRVPLSGAVSLFFQVTGVSVLASSRAFNLAGYVDEAQSKVEWSQRPLSDPALSVTGAVPQVQSWGSALQLSPNLHTLAPDGLFAATEAGVDYVPLPPPTPERRWPPS